jgi:single-stranded-DNA-specific exonuclease
VPSASSNESSAAFVRRVEWRPAPVPAAGAAALAAAGYAPQLAALLARRGVDGRAAAEAFLHPALEQLHDPRALAGVDAAVARLRRARDEREPVALVGDYDVDGVCGTAILTAVLAACKVDVRPILPHRLRDGYGFQPAQVDEARRLGCRVIVTVDCGTTSIAAAREALAAGLDVVVTDHHIPGEPLPAGVVQINPRQDGCDYPFPDLCGAGLALKLALAFAADCGREVDPRALLRVACLGTIADLVPLTGENRVIAAVGLEELARTRSPGIRALIRVARLRQPYSTDDVGFRLGPRLNAPGRLDSAEKALELLLARDRRRAEELALDLDRCNRERQDEERRVAEEAHAAVLERLARGETPAILVAWSEGWHRGVVGIAAGRLARAFNRPTVLLSLAGEEATGSGRSVPAVHLFRFLSRWREELPRFGGHAQAIGLTVRRDQLEDLRRRWEEAAAAAWGDEVAVRRYDYELDLAAGEVTWDFFKELRQLEPFGEGNPRPLVRVRGPLRLARAPHVFGHGHLAAAAVGAGGVRIRLLGWGWQERAGTLLQGDFEVLGVLEYDRYRGGCRLQLVDARPSAHGP